MPHVGPLKKSEAPRAAQPLLEAIEEKYGKVLNTFGTMAHQPDILKGVATINDGLQKDLPAKLRELAYYKASQINGCDYCSHYHRQAARQAGLTGEQLDAISNSSPTDHFSDEEVCVLAYSEQLTKSGHVDDEVVQSVQKHLSDKQLVTLAATVALANFTNRFNHGLDVQLP